jgi:hypothetical protein
MLSTHRFTFSCLLLFEYVCVYIWVLVNVRWCVCVCVCVRVCVVVVGYHEGEDGENAISTNFVI